MNLTNDKGEVKDVVVDWENRTFKILPDHTEKERDFIKKVLKNLEK